MATGTKEGPKNKSQLQLLKLDKAFKLAEQWVNSMSKSSADQKSISVDLGGRPSRLGIGATVPKESRVTYSNNPVERKLLAYADKKKVMARDGDLAPSAKDGNVDEESDKEELESKTRSFGKKRPPSFNSPLNGNKKRR